jgi:hypothetical protein
MEVAFALTAKTMQTTVSTNSRSRGPKAATMKENRTQVRFEVSLTARWEGSASTQNVRIGDLSLGGCYFDTVLDVTVGEMMFLSIQKSDGEWLELRGVVAHHYPRLGFGVRFVDLDENQLRQIRSLLKLQAENSVDSSEMSMDGQTSLASQEIDYTSRGLM